jgi:hypothetical protein
MPAHLKSFVRNSDVYKKKIIMPFLTFEKRDVTQVVFDNKLLITGSNFLLKSSKPLM